MPLCELRDNYGVGRADRDGVYKEMSYLIKDTTREEREQIVSDSLGNISGTCDGCAAGLADMYQDYIDGVCNERFIKEILNEYYTVAIVSE